MGNVRPAGITEPALWHKWAKLEPSPDGAPRVLNRMSIIASQMRGIESIKMIRGHRGRFKQGSAGFDLPLQFNPASSHGRTAGKRGFEGIDGI